MYTHSAAAVAVTDTRDVNSLLLAHERLFGRARVYRLHVIFPEM